jgi:isoleucyl-tRNA synthetase
LTATGANHGSLSCMIHVCRLVQLFPELNKAEVAGSQEKQAELFTVVERLKGSDLVGMRYVPLFDYFKAQLPDAFRVVSDNYVTEEGGTGIVHQAPAFGEDDYRVCLAHGIVAKGAELPCPVDMNGRFTAPVNEYAGRGVKDCDADICMYLKAKGRLIVKDQYMHSYPYCWRSDTPLIYKVSMLHRCGSSPLSVIVIS